LAGWGFADWPLWENRMTTEGTFTQNKEHPWSTGVNFPIFGGTAISSLANAPSSSSGAVGMSGNATAASNFESVNRTGHSSRIVPLATISNTNA
jgi:hypothetical protein